jgi:hypothetical protein
MSANFSCGILHIMTFGKSLSSKHLVVKLNICLFMLKLSIFYTGSATMIFPMEQDTFCLDWMVVISLCASLVVNLTFILQ